MNLTLILENVVVLLIRKGQIFKINTLHMTKRKYIFQRTYYYSVFFRVYNNRNGMFKNLHREIENNIPTKTKRHI